LLETNDWTIHKLMDRYDLVLHLETAAIDTDVYERECANNEARHETKEQAIAQEIKTSKAWAMHPNVKLIRNLEGKENIDFPKKLQRAVSEVYQHLGLGKSVPTLHQRYYLLQHVSSSVLHRKRIEHQTFTIEQTFLQGQSDRVLERRGNATASNWSYGLATSSGPEDDRKITSTRIGAAHYAEYLKTRDPHRYTVMKKRTVFVVELLQRNVTHKIDEYINIDGAPGGGPSTNLELLLVDESEDSPYQVPAFLQPFVIREISNAEQKAKYTLNHLAQTAPETPSPAIHALKCGPSNAGPVDDLQI